MVQELKKLLQSYFSNQETQINDSILDMVESLCKNEIEPYARDMDKFGTKFENKTIIIHPRMLKIVTAFKKNDLFGLSVPEIYNGSGLSHTLTNCVIERISQADASARSYISLQETVIDFILHGSEELKQFYIPQLATGKRYGGLLLTESSSGSDLASIKTKAVRDGNHYVINGQKIFITNCHIADSYLLLASTTSGKGTRGLTAFLLDSKKQSGVNIVSLENKLGIKASPTGVVVLENVEIPVENRVGEENHGFSITLNVLAASRIAVAAGATGLAYAAYKKAINYANQRVQFNSPILKFQANQFKIADMATKIHVARNYYIYASFLKYTGKKFKKEASIAKLFASEMAQEVTYDAIQLHGGYGFIQDYDVERYYRDARITTLFEGTSEIQRLIISREEINTL